MNAFSSNSLSGNRKSKIQNLKWVGFFAFPVALTVCGARADAQQTGRVARIGFLDNSTAESTRGQHERFIVRFRSALQHKS
jgi:hypothetical protein